MNAQKIRNAMINLGDVIIEELKNDDVIDYEDYIEVIKGMEIESNIEAYIDDNMISEEPVIVPLGLVFNPYKHEEFGCWVCSVHFGETCLGTTEVNGDITTRQLAISAAKDMLKDMA